MPYLDTFHPMINLLIVLIIETERLISSISPPLPSTKHLLDNTLNPSVRYLYINSNVSFSTDTSINLALSDRAKKAVKREHQDSDEKVQHKCNVPYRYHANGRFCIFKVVS